MIPHGLGFFGVGAWVDAVVVVFRGFFLYLRTSDLNPFLMSLESVSP